MKRTGGALLFLLLIILGPAARAEAPSPTPLTAEILWQIQRLGGPALSPDGRWAAVPVTTPDLKADKALTDLWLSPPARPRPSGSRTASASPS